ncbi:MAG: hypothetical protein F6K08_14240 [Okeania sp. SIO1H6]|nr:hypothetical protein [Okeania sp. SIO1H6]
MEPFLLTVIENSMAEIPNSPRFLQIKAIKIGAIQAKKSFLLALVIKKLSPSVLFSSLLTRVRRQSDGSPT